MNVYVVIIEDRHADVDAEVFEDDNIAVKRAKALAKDYCRFPEDYEERLNDAMIKDGWLFHAQYSCEGDHVKVLARELK